MELRQLEYFIAVAEERNFTRAARRLHIVQSGLSAAIRTLERDLGAQLFRRSTKQVELTEAGRALLVEARKTLRAAASARAAVEAVGGLLTGSVTIGTMQFLHVVDLPKLLGRFHAAHPGVEIRLHQAGAVQLLEGVRTGELDLAFTAVPGRMPPGVELHELAAESLAVACAPEHPLAERERVDLANLADETFVDFAPEWGLRIATDQAFAAAGISRHSAFVINDFTTALQLVEHGLGIALVPVAAARPSKRLRVVPVRRNSPVVRYSLVYPTGGPAGAAGVALLRLLLTSAPR